MTKCVPGMAQLLKVIGLRSQYFNGTDITLLCWRDKNIPRFHQSNPSIQPCLSPSLLPLSLTHFLPTFLRLCMVSLTMGGLRLLHVGGVGFLRVIAGPVAHRMTFRSMLWRDYSWSLSFVCQTLLMWAEYKAFTMKPCWEFNSSFKTTISTRP